MPLRISVHVCLSSDSLADPPRGEEYWIPTDPRFAHGVDLVSYIKTTPEFSDFCVGVAGNYLFKALNQFIRSFSQSDQLTRMVTLRAIRMKMGRLST